MTLSIAKLEKNETPTRNSDGIVFTTAVVESGFAQGPLNRGASLINCQLTLFLCYCSCLILQFVFKTFHGDNNGNPGLI